MIYNNLPLILAGDAAPNEAREPQADFGNTRLSLTLEIDRAMRKKAPAGWRGDDAREKQVLNALFPLMGRDRKATRAVFEIVKNQQGYA